MEKKRKQGKHIGNSDKGDKKSERVLEKLRIKNKAKTR